MRLLSTRHKRRLVAVVAAAAAVTWPLASCDRRRDAVAKLDTALQRLGSRPFEGRLATPFTHVQLRMATRGATGSEAYTLATEVLASPAADAASRRAHGIAYLLLNDPRAAVGALTGAAQEGADAAIWNDLAVAHLALGDTPDATPLAAVDALVAADRALALEPGMPAAAFNRVLALERLGLRGAARSGLQTISGSDAAEWGDDVNAASRRLGARNARAPWREAAVLRAIQRGDDGEILGLVRAQPREARAWGETVFGGMWADAVLRGDHAAAQSMLAVMSGLGAALERSTGERLLASAARVAAESDAARQASLARAYVLYRDGRLAHNQHQPVEAERRLRAARKLFARMGSPMALVASYYVGSALRAQSRIPEALAELETLAASGLEERSYFGLAAQLGWERGLCRLESGSISAAIAIFERSRRLFERLGEHDSRASMEEFLGDALDIAGDEDEAWKHRRVALAGLDAAGDEPRLAVALSEAAQRASRAGEHRRAVSLLNVTCEITARLRQAELAAQAFLQRAEALGAIGDIPAADRDLLAARSWISQIGDARLRERAEVRSSLTLARLRRERDPDGAAALLASAARFLENSGATVDLPAVYLEHARAERGAHRVAAARVHCDRALRLLDAQRNTIADLRMRSMTVGVSREVFDEAIALALDDGDAEAAFELAERAQARTLLELFERNASATVEPMSARAIRASLASDAAIVAYAVLADRTVAFVVRPDALVAVSLGTSRGTSGHAALVAPLFEHLAAVAHVTVVANARLRVTPYELFAAEADTLPLQSLTESPSATLAVRLASAQRPGMPHARHAIVIAGTDFDAAAHPRLQRLPLVASEVRNIAALYGAAEVLEGKDATPGRVLSALRGADVIHFAGHAIAAARRADQSRFLLAPDGERADVDALAIAGLWLPETELVYLSACRSAQAARRGDGIENLAQSFLVAGVRSVIATREDIEDKAAAAAAEAIHALVARGEDPATAVTAVQRRYRLESRQWPAISVIGASSHLCRRERSMRET